MMPSSCLYMYFELKVGIAVVGTSDYNSELQSLRVLKKVCQTNWQNNKTISGSLKLSSLSHVCFCFLFFLPSGEKLFGTV